MISVGDGLIDLSGTTKATKMRNINTQVIEHNNNALSTDTGNGRRSTED